MQPEILLLEATAGILPRSVSITKNFVMLVTGILRGVGMNVHDEGVRRYCKEVRL